MSLVLRIRVRPGARTSELVQEEDGSWLARLKSPPVEGRANAELVALVAQRFGVRRSQVAIRGGATGRLKRIEVEGIEA